uniref:NAD(P)-binding domain-containing protein n=1 Tax=Chaetoceros debilis TaxID=122233 RepID=A0A7S3VCL8_9STRA|mmetsp:Transcript_9697/g.14546  ORF Transcript_9697/g.14546 Transcript_9697/m.14546 type:complete len:939 (+) Transcript_9697:383-3199(+)
MIERLRIRWSILLLVLQALILIVALPGSSILSVNGFAPVAVVSSPRKVDSCGWGEGSASRKITSARDCIHPHSRHNEALYAKKDNSDEKGSESKNMKNNINNSDNKSSKKKGGKKQPQPNRGQQQQGKSKQKQKQKQQKPKNVKSKAKAKDILPIEDNVQSPPKDDGNKSNSKSKKDGKNILSLLSNAVNPYKAGQTLRQTLTNVISNTVPTRPPLSPEERSIYYLDDRFMEESSSNSGGGGGGTGGDNSNAIVSQGALAFAQRTGTNSGTAGSTDVLSLLNESENNNDGYIPEVLVIGATGAIGRLVVRQLVRSPKFRVRVLVRDLYSQTLNMLGTGVTYCQGDLGSVESLEYAVTDVDKIVFCAGPPRRDEDDFKSKFEEFVKENLSQSDGSEGDDDGEEEVNQEVEYFQLMTDTLEVRAKLAQQVDDVGMQNLVRAWCDVRHADYGTSQAAKRSLFKFQDREEDFYLFDINVDDDDDDDYDDYDSNYQEVESNTKKDTTVTAKKVNMGNRGNDNDGYDDDYGDDKYEDTYGDDKYKDYDEAYESSSSNSSPTSPKTITPASVSVQSQVAWIKNQFDHGVFVGKVPSALNGSVGSEASIISSRLRSRDDPEQGTDLRSNGFAGFVCRVCADGKTYQAFIRTSDYETYGIEYVCSFETATKPSKGGNKSMNKFMTLRLPFADFKPVIRKQVKSPSSSAGSVSMDEKRFRFIGKDVKQIGFRIDSAENLITFQDRYNAKKRFQPKWVKFYLALCYIKVYRSQPEPEFIYLSDSRIPSTLKNGMVRHDIRRIQSVDSQQKEGSSSSSSEGVGGAGDSIFDEAEAKRVLENPKDRSGEELYYKYRGEEILKNSGLQYSICRVPTLNELPSGEFSTIQLKKDNDKLTAVSRAEVAAVCVSALLDPNARNSCFYLTKGKSGGARLDSREDAFSDQFSKLNPQ